MNKVVAIVAVLLTTAFSLHAFTVPDKPTGYVNDYANILSIETKQALENELKSFTASTSNEIAIVTISDLGGDTVENYASKLFASWKIGNAKDDNGILLLISRDDRKLRIEVGYGLEGALPDILAKDIIDNKITPSFKQGDYNSGVTQGVKAIEDATRGEYQRSEKTQAKSSSFLDNADGLIVILVMVFMILQFITAILARSKSWWAGGVLGGVVGGTFTYLHFFGLTLFIGSIVTVALVLLGLLFDYFVSSSYRNSIKSGGSIPWWIGGNRGGYSGGSSFGGFSGGSSGGGGASGSW